MPTFPQNPALEAAVIADAERDLPRLVYADWLEENGDEARAHFIRVQCALWDKNPGDDDWCELVEAKRYLFAKLKRRAEDFAPPAEFRSGRYDDFSEPDNDYPTYRSVFRGFPYVARGGCLPIDSAPGVSSKALSGALTKLFTNTTIRSMAVDKDILDLPESASLSAVRIDNRDAFQALPGSPAVPSLRWLEMSLYDDKLTAALAKAKFQQLTQWDCYQGVFASLSSFRTVVKAPWFRKLRRVRIRLRTDQGETFFAEAHRNRELHTLQLWFCESGSLDALEHATGFESLSRLLLRRIPLTDAIAATLGRLQLPKLRAFESECDELNNKLFSKLLEADWFGQLHSLNLTGPDIGDAAVVSLAKHPVASGLKSLTLRSPKLKGRGCKALTTAFPNLLSLVVHPSTTCATSADELRTIPESLAAPALRHLTLSNVPLDDAGAKKLAANPLMSNLTSLDISYTQVGATGVRAILESPHLRKLVYLNLMFCKCAKGMASLVKSDVLPELGDCWLPDDVKPELRDQLTEKRDVVFTG